MSAAALFSMLVLVLMSLELLISLFSQLVELRIQSLVGLHYLEHLCSAELIPVCRNDLGCLVQSSYILYYLIELRRGHSLLMRKEDGACVLYLIRKELSEVLHVHLISLCVNDCGESIELDLFVLEILHSDDDVGKLSYSGRFYEDPVRIVLLNDLVQGLSEISDEGAADAARYHLVDLDSRLPEEACIDSDLSELVLYQHDVLCVIAFGYEFLYKCGLSCSEEPGENIYFCHLFCLSSGHNPPFIRIRL